MSAPIACWRVKGDPSIRMGNGEWTDGAPDADTLAEYNRLGWELEYAYAYAAPDVAKLAAAAQQMAAFQFEHHRKAKGYVDAVQQFAALKKTLRAALKPFGGIAP